MGNANSGRRSNYKEIRIGKLAEMSVDWAIEHWPEFCKTDKMKILLSLAPKFAERDNTLPLQNNLVIVRSANKSEQTVTSDSPVGVHS